MPREYDLVAKVDRITVVKNPAEILKLMTGGR
jgi:hypothetical protein